MRITVLFLSLALPLALAACGVKPDHVDPPPHVKTDTYPHTYPDTQHDPAPERHAR